MDAINLKIPQFVPLMTSLFVHWRFCYDDYMRVTATSHCFFSVWKHSTLFFEDIPEILEAVLINTFKLN